MYRSPESFYFDITSEGKRCDMWSFGIMTVEILTLFFLVDNLPPSDSNWLVDIYPTLFEILQEHRFTWFFELTFIQPGGSENKDAKMALDFVHGFLKIEPSERTTCSEAGKHPFLTRGSLVRKDPDKIWTNELFMSATEFKDTYIRSFNGDLENNVKEEEISKIDIVCFNSEKTSVLESKNKYVEEYEIPVSEKIRNLRLRIKEFTENSGKIKDGIAQEGAHLKICNHSKLFSEDFGEAPSKPLANFDETLALASINKFSVQYQIPVSEKIRNLRLRIKEVTESGKIEVKNVQKGDHLQKEKDAFRLNEPPNQIKTVKDSSDNFSDCSAGDFFKIKSQAHEHKAESRHSHTNLDPDTTSVPVLTKPKHAKGRVPVSKKVKNLRQRIKRLAETSGIMEERVEKDSVESKSCEFSTCTVLGIAAENPEIPDSSGLEEKSCPNVVPQGVVAEINGNQLINELSLQLKPANRSESSLNKIDFEYNKEEELRGGIDLNCNGDETYVPKQEDTLRENKLTQELRKISDDDLDNHSKVFEEDFTTVLEPISDAAKLDSMLYINSPSKHSEDYESITFESSYVSNRDIQASNLKINSFDHNSAESKLPADSKRTTSVQIRGSWKSTTVWFRSKCLSFLMFCCPCMTANDT